MEKKMAKKRQKCEKKQKITEPYFPWRERCWFSIVVAEMKVGVEERQNPCTRRPTPCLKYKMRNIHKWKMSKHFTGIFYERFWLMSSPLVLIYIYPNVAVGKTLARKVEWLCLHSLLALTATSPPTTTTTATTFSTKILLCHDNNLHLPEIMVFVCFELCQ